MDPIKVNYWGTPVTWNRYLLGALMLALSVMALWALSYWLTIQPLPKLPATEDSYTRFLFWFAEQMPWWALIGTLCLVIEFSVMRRAFARKHEGLRTAA